MKYSDSEIYLNNPTLDLENQGEYQTDSLLQLGILTTLPPAAMWIINRAKAVDRRRNVLYRIKDYERNVRLGTHFVKNATSQKIITDARLVGEYFEYNRDVEELRALESDPESDVQDLERRKEQLDARARRLTQDHMQKPWSYHVSDADRQASSLREDVMRNRDWEWLRAREGGESIQDATEKLSNIKLLAELREVVDVSTQELPPDKLTSSGQKALRMLKTTFESSFGGEEKFDIKFFKGSAGMYRVEVKVNGVSMKINNAMMNFEIPAFQGSYAVEKHLQELTRTGGKFDGRLFNSFMVQDQFLIASQGSTRKPIVGRGFKDGNVEFVLPSKTAYDPGGEFDSTIRSVRGAIRNFMKSDRTQADWDTAINKTSSYFIGFAQSDKVSETMEKGYASSLASFGVVTKIEGGIGNEDVDRIVNYQQKHRLVNMNANTKTPLKQRTGRIKSSVSNAAGKVIMGGVEIDMEASFTTSSASGLAEQGKVTYIPRGSRRSGGHAQGQASLRTNLAEGFNVNKVLKGYGRSQEKYVGYFERKKQLRDYLKRLRRQHGTYKTDAQLFLFEEDQKRFNRTVNLRKKMSQDLRRLRQEHSQVLVDRYDLVNKRDADISNSPEESSFRVRRAVVVMDEPLIAGFGVGRDQSLTVSRYGANFADMYNNPAVDLVQVGQSITYSTKHVVTFDEQQKIAISDREEQGKSNSVKSTDSANKRHFNSVRNKLRKAERDGEFIVLLSKSEAEAFDVPTKEDMRVKAPRGSTTDFKEPHYAIVFEKTYSQESMVSRYKFGGSYNTKSVYNPTKESAKTTNALVSTQTVEDLRKFNLDGIQDATQKRAAVEISRRVGMSPVHQMMAADTLVGKGYSAQVADSIFTRVISQAAANELEGASSSEAAKRLKGSYASKFHGNQSFIRINGSQSRGDKGLFTAAEDLFSTLVLGRKRGTAEKILSQITINKVEGTGEVTVSYALHPQMKEKMRNSDISDKLLMAIKKMDENMFKEINNEVNTVFVKRGLKSENIFFDSIDADAPEGTRYVNSAITMIKGDSKTGSKKSIFLDVMFGQGVSQGHNFYPDVGRPIYGKNFYESGPTLSAIELVGLSGSNKALAKMYQNMLHANFQKNYIHSHAMLTFNRHLNSETLANQNMEAKRLVQAGRLESKRNRELLKEITFMTKDAFLDGGTADETGRAVEKVRKTKIGDITIRDVLDRYKKIDSTLGTGDKAKQLIELLGLDEMYIDGEDQKAIESYFNKDKSLISELVPHSRMEVTAIELLDDIRITSLSSEKGNPRTNLLWMAMPRPEDIARRVTTDDLSDNLKGLVGEARERKRQELLRIIERSQRDGVVNAKVISGTAQKQIQIETLNHINRMLNQARKEGASGEDEIRLKQVMGLMKHSIENLANNYLDDSAEQVGYGKKAQEQFKLAPGFSAGLNIQTFDPINPSWADITRNRKGFEQQELEWNAILLNRKQIAEMAKTRMVSGNRALDLISNPIVRKYSRAIFSQEIGELKTELGVMGKLSSPLTGLYEQLDSSNEVDKLPTKIERHSKGRLSAISRNLKSFTKLGVKSWGELSEAMQDNSAKNIHNLAKIYSKEGIYRRISDKFEGPSLYQKDVAEAWRGVSEDIEAIRRTNKNKKGNRVGRLKGKRWMSIGKRLHDKTLWETVNSTLDEAIESGTDGSEDLKVLKASLNAGRLDYAEMENKKRGIRVKGGGSKKISRGISELYSEFESKAGKNYQVLELMERANIDATELNSFMKENGAASSQLSSYIDNIDKRRQKLAKDFIGFEALANKMQSTLSFNSEQEMLNLIGMDDSKIQELAEQKTKMMLEVADELSSKLSKNKDKLSMEALERINAFKNELAGVKGELGFTKELATSYRFLKGALTTGVSATEAVDPSMIQYKHMKHAIIRTVMDKEIKDLENKSPHEKEVLLKWMRQDSAKVGSFFESLLERDFDGDRIKTLANIIDTRWQDKKLSMSTHNVLQAMSDGAFIFRNGNLTAANVVTGRTTESMLYSSFKAKDMQLTNIQDFVKKSLEREYVQEGALAGGSKNEWMETRYKEVISEWIKENHSGKLSEEEKQKLLSNVYIKTEVKTNANLSADKVLNLTLVSGNKVENLQYSKEQTRQMTAEGFINEFLDKNGMSKDSESYLTKSFSVVNGKDLIERGIEFSKKFETHNDVSRHVDELKKVVGKDSEIFLAQKSLTGELYKYPILMRAFGESLTAANPGMLREAGKLFGEVATYAAAMFQQNLAIGIKKGGQLAGVGVKQLYQEMYNLGMLSNEDERKTSVDKLYTRIEKEGILSDVQEEDLKVLRSSGYADKMLKGKNKTQFGTLQLLSFGQAKQMAIEDLLTGKGSKNLETFLDDKFEANSSDRDSVASKLRKDILREAMETRQQIKESGKGEFSRRKVIEKMYEDQIKSNATMASTNASYIKFGKLTIESSVNLYAAAKQAGVADIHRKMMGVLGDVSKDPNNKDFLMDLFFKSKKHGVEKSSVYSDFLNKILESGEDMIGQEDMKYLRSITQGRMGNYNKMEPAARKVHTLFSPNSTKNLAVAALGLLAVGTFAPDVNVGSGRESYIDKRPEIESELPRKMLAQYSNQANVSYVPPWVKERMAAERREKTTYNSMFFNSLTS